MIASDDSRRQQGVIVDSSLWIEYYQPGGRGDVQAAVQGVLASDEVGITAMIFIEVLRGALTVESLAALENDFTALHWLDVTPEVAKRGAEIGFHLDRAGKRVPATDLMIAAAAIGHGYVLWHNDRHFEVIAEESTLLHRRFEDD